MQLNVKRKKIFKFVASKVIFMILTLKYMNFVNQLYALCARTEFKTYFIVCVLLCRFKQPES